MAQVDPMIARGLRGRAVEVDHPRAFREGWTPAEPDLFEEITTDQHHRVDTGERAGDRCVVVRQVIDVEFVVEREIDAGRQISC